MLSLDYNIVTLVLLYNPMSTDPNRLTSIILWSIAFVSSFMNLNILPKPSEKKLFLLQARDRQWQPDRQWDYCNRIMPRGDWDSISATGHVIVAVHISDGAMVKDRQLNLLRYYLLIEDLYVGDKRCRDLKF